MNTQTDSEKTKRLNLPVVILVALISATASILSIFVTWFLTERIRTDISAQTLALERVKVDLSSQTLALEKVKVDIAAAAQRTAETSTRIDNARLDLDRRIAQSTEYLSNRKVQIEDKRTTTDEIRLTPEFARLSNDLRPALEIDCKAETEDGSFYKVNCTFRNKGAHRCGVIPTGVSLLDRATQKPIEKAIVSFENGDSNSILAGGSGSNWYSIRLAPSGAAVKKPIIQLTFRANTDAIAVNMLKRLAKGTLTDDELAQLSIQNYTWNIWL